MNESLKLFERMMYKFSLSSLPPKLISTDIRSVASYVSWYLGFELVIFLASCLAQSAETKLCCVEPSVGSTSTFFLSPFIITRNGCVNFSMVRLPLQNVVRSVPAPDLLPLDYDIWHPVLTHSQRGIFLLHIDLTVYSRNS
jgi:hypothetical protein